MTRRRRAKGGPRQGCQARWCSELTRNEFCPKHWDMVPTQFRTSIRHGSGLAYKSALALTIDAIAIREGYCGED